jgi:hypothetical protein
MKRTLLRLALHLDQWHLRWGLREIDQRKPDAAYIVVRLANVEQKLVDLRRSRCA